MKKSISITCKSGELIEIAKLERFQGDLKEITPESMDKLKASIVKYGFSFPIFVWKTKILDGHQRLEAAKQLIKDGYMLKGGKLPVVQISAESDQEAAEKLLLINSRYAQMTQSGFDAFITDFDIDLSDFSGLLEIPEIDFDFDGGGGSVGNTDTELRVSLTDRFLIPPFSVFDMRQGYWRARKQAWQALGIKSELGRGDNLLLNGDIAIDSDLYRNKNASAKAYITEHIGEKYGGKEVTGTSIFDPVLCEVIYRWYSKEGAAVLDPFAGGSVRGIVAAYLGRYYTGVDLRAEQIAANRKQYQTIINKGEGHKIKISAKSARQLFKACEPNYIKNVCKGSCCESSTHESGTRIAIRDFERATIEKRGGLVNDGYLQSVDKRCPFKSSENLCSLHATNDKPFGCIASPFVLNNNGTLVIRNRYRLLKCYKDKGDVPAYKNFRPSLDLILGPYNAQVLNDHLDAGGGDIVFEIDEKIYQRLTNKAEQGIVEWITGDSAGIDKLCAGRTFDLLFSCPPYADLEVYSDDPADISTLPYADFLNAYRTIIKKCYALLSPDSFAAWVVGEVRDKAGVYYNFVGDTISAFLNVGFNYYNEAILINSLNTLPIRAPRAFEASRKIGKCHQNVLVFVKGDAKTATEKLGRVDLDFVRDLYSGDAGGD